MINVNKKSTKRLKLNSVWDNYDNLKLINNKSALSNGSGNLILEH